MVHVPIFYRNKTFLSSTLPPIERRFEAQMATSLVIFFVQNFLHVCNFNYFGGEPNPQVLERFLRVNKSDISWRCKDGFPNIYINFFCQCSDFDLDACSYSFMMEAKFIRSACGLILQMCCL